MLEIDKQRIMLPALHHRYLGIVRATSYYLLSTIILSSCGFMTPEPATEEQKKQVISKARFDSVIIADRKKYEAFEKFLLVYRDTIISFRDNDSYVIEVSNADKIDTVLQKQDCYYFSLPGADNDLKNIPDFLKLKLDSVRKVAGGVHIKAFSLCKDKEIEIQVKSEGGENGLYIDHYLIWNAKVRDYRYVAHKDTLLDNNFLYKIGMTEYHGH